jgi:hypothetical protein
MAGIDRNNVFPNSMMAAAARAGQSRFRSVESAAATSVGAGVSSGVFTLNTAGAKNMAALLAAAGLTTSFNSLSVAIVSSANGVTIAQGAGSNVYQQGAIVNFSNVSATSSPLTITLAAGDVVSFTYTGV